MGIKGTREPRGAALTDEDRVQYDAIADPAEPRCWRHFIYAPNERVARDIAATEMRDGWAIPRLASAAGQEGWVVVAQQHDVLISLHAIAQARRYFTDVARSHAAHYDGWEATPSSQRRP